LKSGSSKLRYMENSEYELVSVICVDVCARLAIPYA